MSNFNEEFKLISGVTLRNRLVMAPMTTTQSFYNGVVTDEEIQYYRDRSNGVGAVITGTAYVEDLGKAWEGELSIADEQAIPQLRKLASAIHDGGAKAILQIFHGGRMVDPAAIRGQEAVSASAVAALRPQAVTPRAMTESEIENTIKAFGEATRRAIEAGFDGVELHGANTYLIQQFFSPHSNRRTDKWGGTLENRYRFLDEVIKSSRSAVEKYAAQPFIVGYRFSPEEFHEPGISFEDTLWLLDQLSEAEIDYLHISLNDFRRKSNSPAYQEQSLLAYVHEKIAGRKPLIAVGGIRTLADVNDLLEQAELAAVGQQILVDPTWAEKILQDRESEIVTKPFEEAFKDLELTSPLYVYLENRYRKD